MTTLKPRTVRVPIYQPDDLDRIGELQHAIAAAAARPTGTPQRLGSPETSYADAVSAYEEFVAEAEPRATVMLVRELGFKKWRSLKAEHPGRTNEQGEALEDDAAIGGLNADSFPEAAVLACLLEPEFSTTSDRVEFVEELSLANLTRAFQAAYSLNEFAVTDPKAWLAFAPTPRSVD